MLGSGIASQKNAPRGTQPNAGGSDDDDDEDDDDEDDELPVRPTDLNEPMSFKRRQKQQASFLPQSARNILHTFGMDRAAPPLSPYAHDTGNGGAGGGIGALGPDEDFETQGVVGGGRHGSPGHPSTSSDNNDNNNKNGAGIPSAVDWYAEGLGRRVGYEDLTAIDWIFEYNKERQRQRALVAGTSGILGHVRRLLDAGQVWVVLVMTGLAMGTLAAGIDVVSDWLGDLKTGYCSSGGTDGGAFYLNHGFCCMGYDEGAKCDGWRPWAVALGVRSSGLGKWFIEYLFFVALSITFAVCASLLVKDYAPYAKHSGIPEIKTMLGGFVIRKFLGAWTLVIKSLGLVSGVCDG